MYKRFFKPPTTSYFLFGPRGTGKTTWLHQEYPDALWIDMLDTDVFKSLSSSPGRVRDLSLGDARKKVVVIDEVQKVPEILSEVHKLIEEKRGLQFILTGSSARKLKREGVDLLAGRALLEKMPPLYAGEMGSDFALPKALTLGMVPLIVNAEDPIRTLKSYAGLYLREEVQAEGLVRKIGDFSRFLEVISFSHGSIINTSNIARECHVDRKTVENYQQILEDLLLCFYLPVFSRRAKRELSVHPKFYFFDCGIFRSFRPASAFDMASELEGFALEGLVGQHLRAWCDQQTEMNTLSFWRTRAWLEVDFIVFGPTAFLAIEVKNSSEVHPGNLRGLLSFKEDYPEATPILLYRGKQRLLQKGILCLPVEEFLLSIHPARPIMPIK
jgi:predicted AAA+ superfamily ATPase